MIWSHLAAFVVGVLVAIWLPPWRRRRVELPVRRIVATSRDGRTLLDLDDVEVRAWRGFLEERPR